MTPSSALTRDKTPQGIRDSTRQDDSGRNSEHRPERFDRTGGSTGGTALVVYGDDERSEKNDILRYDGYQRRLFVKSRER
ncbi:hypothetical protein [Sporisorium scitamineum]|uniref:Uncharacterized protein n=1 Tax=Sporisorium scitamineum TaxID=49012 RepID=A0A0F7S9G7_9BASI|nr:hypothetical protein [Sporisorium scitamineum]